MTGIDRNLQEISITYAAWLSEQELPIIIDRTGVHEQYYIEIDVHQQYYIEIDVHQQYYIKIDVHQHYYIGIYVDQ